MSTFPFQSWDLVQGAAISVNQSCCTWKTLFHWCYHALCFLHLSVSSSWEFPEPCGEQLDGDISFRNECCKVSHFRHIVPLVNLCTSAHLLQEDASLMEVEPDTNLWVQRNVTRNHFIAMFFFFFFGRQQYLICP